MLLLHENMTLKALLSALSLIFTVSAKDLDLANDDEWLLNLNLNPRAEPLFKIFIFNFTNPEEFLSGEKPNFVEVGPYVYKESYIKDELKWVSDGKISYVPKRIYKFSPRDSRPNRQIDRITTINVPMITALQQLKIGTPTQRNTINSLLDVLKQKSYEKLLVRHLIWGAKNPLIKLGRDIKPKDDPTRYPYEKFGIFVGRNFTNQGMITETTGLTDEGHIGQIVAWNNQPNWGLWREGSECDKAQGSYGFFFKPNLQKTDTIHLYRKDFCRAIPMQFKEEIQDEEQYGGLLFYRFSPSSKLLDAPSEENSESRCFCKGGSCRGVPSGTFNISLCSYGAPILLSMPHFLNADESVKEEVNGLEGNPDIHDSYIDIEPVTGMTLGVKAGLQMNVKISPDETVPKAKGLRELVFPLAYFMDESKVEDQTVIDRLKTIIEKRQQ